MNHRVSGFLLTLTSFALLGACGDPFGPRGTRVVGIIEWIPGGPMAYAGADAAEPGGALEVVRAPSEVKAGVAFDAVVTTVGPNLCWRADGATNDVRGNVAVVVPYDLTVENENAVCADAIAELPRTVTVTFATPGMATLRVEGRRVVGKNQEESAVVEKQIVVHP